ncbi:hypothetical protein PS850_05607 [Pseudomonas fluorescens]|nr:hypothetical protein PS850_05607 [Pseudomonas fluorescens]
MWSKSRYTVGAQDYMTGTKNAATAHCRSELAPGGVPTMVVNDNACLLVKRGALESIASKLAPTGAAFP